MASTRRKQRRLPGITREDSDDELGDIDLPWEWIRKAGSPNGNIIDDEGLIIGARMGGFCCHVGDTVLLKAEGVNEAWIGIICQFLDDKDNEKAANFMWFSTEKEIRNRAKKRNDSQPNELYITPSWDINSLAAINGKATILSWTKFMKRFPNGKIPSHSKDFGKVFICRRGCNTRTATYTDEFIWEDIYKGSESDVYQLIDFVKAGTKNRANIASQRSPSSAEDQPWVPTAPRGSTRIGISDFPEQKRLISKPRPPLLLEGRTTDLKLGARAAGKKTLEFTPLATRTISQDHASPFQLARARLHVSAIPATLPCRENEFIEVYTRLTEAIADGAGNCFYISGTPGTGKTATVREVVSHLELAVRSDELEDFIFVEINGMKITDPYQSYSLLWDALKGQRVSPSQALDLLDREFSNPSPRRVPCVVLMDELDQLVTKNQGIMYNFFNWPSLRHSRLIVLAVANTMDLPERTLSNKISSRLGLTRITFPGYTHEQLMKIIHSRLDGIPGNIVEPDAIQFASRKVAAVSGDARRALDICRRAVELAESSPLNGTVAGVSKEKPEPDTGKQRVTIATIKKAINEAISSPVQQHLRSIPLCTKIVLVSLVRRLQRSGLAEATVGDVMDETDRVLDHPSTGTWLSVIEPPRSNKGEGILQRSFGVREALVDLANAGLVSLESQRADRPHKLRMIVGVEEVKMGFRDDADIGALVSTIP